jgi:membrane protease YdiL (CAAX protease family)
MTTSDHGEHETTTDHHARRRVTFDGGLTSLAAFAVAFAAVVAIWVPLTDALAGESALVRFGADVAKFAVVGGLALGLLRYDGVSLPEIGFSRRHLVTGVAAFGLLWVALNVLGGGLAVAFGNEWGLRQIWALPDAPAAEELYAPLPAPWAALVLFNFLVVGVVEEVAFRGYLQSKIVALLGDGSRRDVALGIGATTVVFGALHTPGAIVAGLGPSGVLAAALLPTITAAFFGVIYEVTGNLPFVALLHGLGNTWPLVIEWGDWSGPALLAFWAGTAAVYLGVILAYRRRAAGTDLAPTVHRSDAGGAGAD